MRIIRYGASFNGNSSVKTWMYLILINQCRAMRSAAPVISAPGIEKQHVQPLHDPPAERNESLHAAVEKLEPPKREILLLCYHVGLTHEQAAEILRIPLGTLKSRLHSALELLRASLKQEQMT